MEEQEEQFKIGLEECVVETSPHFDELPGEPPAKKMRRQKVAQVINKFGFVSV